MSAATETLLNSCPAFVRKGNVVTNSSKDEDDAWVEGFLLLYSHFHAWAAIGLQNPGCANVEQLDRRLGEEKQGVGGL